MWSTCRLDGVLIYSCVFYRKQLNWQTFTDVAKKEKKKINGQNQTESVKINGKKETVNSMNEEKKNRSHFPNDSHFLSNFVATNQFE